MAQVQATQEPPPGYTPVVETLVVETDGVMARYRDHQLDGTLIKGEWHEIKLGLAGDWQDGQLVNSSYVAARETATRFAPRLGTEAARRGRSTWSTGEGWAAMVAAKKPCCAAWSCWAMEPSGSGSTWPPSLTASASKSWTGI